MAKPPTAAQHLQTIIDRWPDLIDAVAARNTSTWPPAGLRHHLQSRSADEVDWLKAHRYLDRNPAQLGEVPAPINLDLIDTMREVEAALRYLADVTAAEIQKPPMQLAPAHWLPETRAGHNRRALADRNDRRRWHWRPSTIGAPRTGLGAAGWLIERLHADGRSVQGPFVRLNGGQRLRIATVAAACANRVEGALAEARRSTPVRWPCPHCRGQLVVQGGDGAAPAVRCTDCGRAWRERVPA